LTVIRYFTGRFVYCRFGPVIVSLSFAAAAGGCFSGALGGFSGAGFFSGPGGGAGGSLNSGRGGPGKGIEGARRVVTDWPCSNCTRAQFLTSLSSVGASTSTISRQTPGGSVPRYHCTSGARAAGSGVARTKPALAGSGLRTRT